MQLICHTFGSAHSEVLLTGSYPDNGHQVKKDFGLLFSQNSTDGVTNNGSGLKSHCTNNDM